MIQAAADVARLDELTGRVSALAAELAELIAAAVTVSGTGAGVSATNASAATGGACIGTFGETRAARDAVADAASGTTAGPASGIRSDAGVDAARVSQLAALEVLKSAVCAVQAQVTAEFADSQRDGQLQAGVPGPRAGRGIASQIGLARRESPNKGQLLLGLSRALVEEMPCTLAALARGELNEWRATLIARETAVLSREHRAAADRELCGPAGPGDEGCPAASMGDAAISRASRAIGQRLDPGAAWKRAQKAQRGRCVTIRPAPDCMVRFTALLPVVQGVGVYAALCAAADTAIALGQNARLNDPDGGDEDEAPLGRGALMADELVARILGQALAAGQNPATSSPGAASSPSAANSGPATGGSGEAGPACGTSSTRATDPGQAARPATEASPADPASSASPASPAGPASPSGPNGSASPAGPAGPASSAGPANRDDRAGPAESASPANPAARQSVREPAVEIQLIMTDWTLFGLDDEPAHLTGYGPIPAPLARRIATGAAGAGEAVRWIRRLYRQPDTGPDTGGSQNGGPGTGGGGLIAMDSRRRLFPAAISRFIVARDQFCRTKWCDALIRHIDHINPAEDGGPTGAANAQGLCEACNYAKQAPGWQQTTGQTGQQTTGQTGQQTTGQLAPGQTGLSSQVITTTPTGHQYVSSPPSPPGRSNDLGTPGRQAAAA